MVRNALDQLGSLQRTIMEAIWSLKEAAVPTVHDAVTTDDRPLAYTTVLSAMQKLEKAGWLERRREGRQHLYRATLSRAEEGRRSLRRITADVFASDPKLLFEHLIGDESITPDELASLESLIERRKRELSND